MPDLPPTVEAAAAEGWTGLSIHCEQCGLLRDATWDELGGARRVNLVEFVGKLVCRKCRQPPRTVDLFRSRDVEGGASGLEVKNVLSNAP